MTAADALKRAIQLHVPVNAVLVGSPYGIVRVPRVGGFVQFIRVPADPSEVKTIAKLSHGRFYVGPRTADLKPVYWRAQVARSARRRSRTELSFAFGLGALALPARRRGALGDLAAEGSVRRLLALAAFWSLSCGATGAPAAGAAARLRGADDLQSRSPGRGSSSRRRCRPPGSGLRCGSSDARTASSAASTPASRTPGSRCSSRA